jgi:hypothetical protein
MVGTDMTNTLAKTITSIPVLIVGDVVRKINTTSFSPLHVIAEVRKRELNGWTIHHYRIVRDRDGHKTKRWYSRAELVLVMATVEQDGVLVPGRENLR